MGCRMWHYVNMVSVRNKMIVSCRVRNVLWSKHLLRNVLLLWNVLLLREIGLLLREILLLWYVVRRMRLMDRVVLKVRLKRCVWYCVQMGCCVRHGMQMVSVRNEVRVCGRVRHYINVCLLMVVLCEGSLSRNECNR